VTQKKNPAAVPMQQIRDGKCRNIEVRHALVVLWTYVGPRNRLCWCVDEQTSVSEPRPKKETPMPAMPPGGGMDY
jgi:hypothetical protein